jgi:hypothetical protein
MRGIKKQNKNDRVPQNKFSQGKTFNYIYMHISNHLKCVVLKEHLKAVDTIVITQNNY